MNTKAQDVVPATSAGDIAKYVLATALAAAGIAVFYLFPQWVAPVRVVLVLVGIAAAVVVMATTALGRRGRDFISESLFELRKVVWPSRQDAMRTTGLVLIVVVIISLILALFDKIIEQLIKLLLY